MNCARLLFSGHAIRRMFERGIGRDDAKEVVARGEGIAEYPDDSPHPSRLMLGRVNRKPIHVLVAVDTATCRVIRGATTVILKGVPAAICENCGEYYLSDDVAGQVWERAERAVKSGAEVEILRFAA